MKPLSEIDLSQFAPEDHVSSSYYKLPAGYPNPVCTGRHLDPTVSTTLNETYCGITTGSENFKLKHKQEHEEILFKTEDSIYSYDHQILQLRSVLKQLNLEKDSAERWEELDPSQRKPYVIRHLTGASLEIIDNVYEKKTVMMKRINPARQIQSQTVPPSRVVATFILRCSEDLSRV